jgi:serine/threonine-protein kinase
VSTQKHPRRDGVTSRQVGRYEVTSALGKGAMGVVYRAHDPLLDRHVAVKVMAATLASEPAVRARFEREARAAARLAHPNVVTVYDFGYHEEAPFVVMELLRGQDLRTALVAGADLPLERRLSIAFQVLAGLSHAHGAGVVHRDVKPANVFLTEAGGVKVLDFGMARVTWAGSTGSGGVVGTFDYMSPEQVESRRVDARSDVFSVGAVLYELLAGEPPFRSDSMVSTAYRIVHGEPDFAPLAHGGRGALEPVLRKALAKDPADRYGSAREFAAELAAHGAAAGPMDAVLDAPAAPAADDAGRAEAPAPAARAARVPSHAKIWAAAIVLAAAGTIAYTVLRPAPVSAPASPTAPSGLASPPAAASPAAARPAPRETPRPASSGLWDVVAPLRTAESPAAAPTPAAPSPAAPEPAPPAAREAAAPARGVWTGYITDESCRQRGGVSGHWTCAQVCMRKGFRPLLAVDGTLYRLDGIERVRGDRNGMVTVQGTLDPATGVIRVARRE